MSKLNRLDHPGSTRKRLPSAHFRPRSEYVRSNASSSCKVKIRVATDRASQQAEQERSSNEATKTSSQRKEDGERVFVSSNEGGVSKSVSMEFIFDDLDYMQTFSIMHTSAYSYLDSHLARMQSLNPLVSYDFSDDFDTEHALSLCRYVDIGFFSCAEWTEEATIELLENAVSRGCIIAVATRGPHGAILFEGQSWFRQAPHPVTPTDTLGAGDAFISGFLVSYVGGKADTGVQPASLIEDSLEKAAFFAAEICLVQGAFGHGLRY